MSEETKLAKFEVILNDSFKWLVNSGGPFADIGMDEWGLQGIFGGNPYRIVFFDKYTSNPYIERVLEGIKYCDGVETDIVRLVKAYQDRDSFSLISRDMIIFWMFFLAALDDEIYNNELDSIIDIAYCMDFDEAMIRDWCRAVEYVMQGNHFSINCDLQLETEEGKQFFLHEGENKVVSTVRNSVNGILKEQNAAMASIFKGLKFPT